MKGDPVLHVADVGRLLRRRIDGTAELDVSGCAIAVEREDSRGRVMTLGVVTGDAVRLPDDRTRVVVHANMLLGKVNIDVAIAPIPAGPHQERRWPRASWGPQWDP